MLLLIVCLLFKWAVFLAESDRVRKDDAAAQPRRHHAAPVSRRALAKQVHTPLACKDLKQPSSAADMQNQCGQQNEAQSRDPRDARPLRLLLHRGNYAVKNDANDGENDEDKKEQTIILPAESPAELDGTAVKVMRVALELIGLCFHRFQLLHIVEGLA